MQLRWPTSSLLSLISLFFVFLFIASTTSSSCHSTRYWTCCRSRHWRRCLRDCLITTLPNTFLSVKWLECTSSPISFHFCHRCLSWQILQESNTQNKTLFFFRIILLTQKGGGHYITCFWGGSGDWFHNWTDLSQSDFFLWSLLLMLLLLLFLLLSFCDCCSWWSSSSWLLSFSSSSEEWVLLIGINSSKTGPSLDVCSEHSDCPCILWSSVVPDNSLLHASIATANIQTSNFQSFSNPPRNVQEKLS